MHVAAAAAAAAIVAVSFFSPKPPTLCGFVVFALRYTHDVAAVISVCFAEIVFWQQQQKSSLKQTQLLSNS